MKKQYIIFSLLLILIVSAFGCGKNGGGGTPAPDIPLWSIDNDGYTRFYTKDVKYYNYYFYRWNGLKKDPMNYVETSVKKVSGNPNYGYGIVFCLQDEDNYYQLLIKTDGRYQISKTVDDVSTHSGWKSSPHLKKGYNVENKIKVEYNSDSSTFSIYFNGEFEDNFTDSKFTGGMFGFFATVGSREDENFPTNPVDIRFKQHYPTASTGSPSIMTENHIPTVSSGVLRR